MSGTSGAEVGALAASMHVEHARDCAWMSVDPCGNCQQWARYAARLLAAEVEYGVRFLIPHRNAGESVWLPDIAQVAPTVLNAGGMAEAVRRYVGAWERKPCHGHHEDLDCRGLCGLVAQVTPLGAERHPEADGHCPTGCGRSVQRGHLMCGSCWREVPKPLQRDVLATWRAYSRAATRGADDFPERRQAYEQARSAALASIR